MEILLVLMVVVCAVLWFQFRAYQREMAEPAEQPVEALLEEVSTVIGDFLEHGRAISGASGGLYGGTISARLQKLDRELYVYTVSMYDSGDVRTYPELEAFARRYGSCYDDKRNALVYLSRHTVRLGEKELDDLENRLYQRIRIHPLAEVKSNALIYTKGLK